MADRKVTKKSELDRLLKILNKSEDHKSLFNRLKKEKRQIETGDFNPDYLGEDDEESYMRALEDIVTNYMYDSNLKKYVKKPKGGMGRLPSAKPIPKGGRSAPEKPRNKAAPSKPRDRAAPLNKNKIEKYIGRELNKNKGGMIDYRSKGLFR